MLIYKFLVVTFALYIAILLIAFIAGMIMALVMDNPREYVSKKLAPTIFGVDTFLSQIYITFRTGVGQLFSLTFHLNLRLVCWACRVVVNTEKRYFSIEMGVGFVAFGLVIHMG